MDKWLFSVNSDFGLWLCLVSMIIAFQQKHFLVSNNKFIFKHNWVYEKSFQSLACVLVLHLSYVILELKLTSLVLPALYHSVAYLIYWNNPIQCSCHQRTDHPNTQTLLGNKPNRDSSISSANTLTVRWHFVLHHLCGD